MRPLARILIETCLFLSKRTWNGLIDLDKSKRRNGTSLSRSIDREIRFMSEAGIALTVDSLVQVAS